MDYRVVVLEYSAIGNLDQILNENAADGYRLFSMNLITGRLVLIFEKRAKPGRPPKYEESAGLGE